MNRFVKIVYKVLGILFLMATFVGAFMMFNSIGKNNTMVLIWMGVFLGGMLGLAVLVIIYIHNKKKAINKIKDENNIYKDE